MGTVAGFLGFRLLGKIAERVGTWLEIRDEVKTLSCVRPPRKRYLSGSADDLLVRLPRQKMPNCPMQSLELSLTRSRR